jgi:hypothetical protein
VIREVKTDKGEVTVKIDLCLTLKLDGNNIQEIKQERTDKTGIVEKTNLEIPVFEPVDFNDLISFGKE